MTDKILSLVNEEFLSGEGGSKAKSEELGELVLISCPAKQLSILNPFSCPSFPSAFCPLPSAFSHQSVSIQPDMI